MSWNVEGLTYLKKTIEDFTKIISNYDIICLYETWTGKNSKITIDGYKAIHSYRRFQHRRAKRASGGIIIYIKDSMKNGVKLVRNDIDSIVWLKLDKQFFCSKSDRYIAAVYIPPEHSPVHEIYNVDFFRKLKVISAIFPSMEKYS